MSSRDYIHLLAGILLSFLLGVTASSKQLDEGKDDMLVAAANQLHRHHIDVRVDGASTAEFQNGRAVLARLYDYPIEDSSHWANPSLFSSEFLDVVFKRVREGEGRHLLLVMPDFGTPLREWQSFQAWKWNVWYQVPPTKRFFITYAASPRRTFTPPE